MVSPSFDAPSQSEQGISPAHPPQTMRLAIVVRALAPYRNQLYDQIGRELGESDAVVIFNGDDEAQTHYPWKAQTLQMSRAKASSVPALRGEGRWLARDWPNPLLWRRLSEFRPTHVWIHEFSPYVLLALTWAKAHRRPCFVSTDIGDRFPCKYITCHKGAQDFIKRRCDGVIACTQDAYETAQRLKCPAVFVPHAIDTTEFVPRPMTAVAPAQKKVRVIQVGILNERKGIDFLLQAFRLCMDARIVDLELILLGGGDHAWARGMIETLGLKDCVRIQSFAQGPDLVVEYQQSDIFALASREDTYAVVVHEAAACGLPLVISREAGASETLVEEGRNGFVVDPADPAQFSRAILRLGADAELRRNFGKRSLEIANRFSVPNCAKQLVGWLRDPR